jgi:hypothetical protein
MEGSASFQIFRPHTLVNRSGRISFSDLSKHNFSTEEKECLCKIISRDVDEFREEMTKQQICDRYQISVNTVKKWQARFTVGKPLNAKAGGPSIFTSQSEVRIHDVLAKNKENYLFKTKRAGAKPRYDKAQTKQLFNVEYQRSQQERKRSNFRPTANPKTLRAAMKRLNVRTGKAGTLTTALLKAG